QTTRLTARFTEMRDIPAFVAINQEGGPADRLRQLFAPIPSMSDAANTGMAQLRRLARVIGAELQATGFNTLFGPVLDLATPGSILRGRTLASSPAAATRSGAAFIEEVADTGTIVCGKHFPGLGGVQRDPHFTLPQVDKPRKLMLMEDIPPFVNLFNVLPMIMVGHAYYPSLSEPTPMPASLSPRVVDKLLRKKLGYQGLIVTDDMTLGAVTGLGLIPERFLEAFEAGNDMLLFSQTTPLVEQAFQLILRAARQSVAMRNRITASVQRILALKRRIPLPLRSGANARTRILRHIDRLSRNVEVTT
ncbi:MAG TPA: glycoside hydrolase family 3 N-terminal domain-containing protein, partial [Terriglobia bacterium]|nr:glycoside hydrolase family 3 N-terminal domain-containing protein [Terriglobia bacterium]